MVTNSAKTPMLERRAFLKLLGFGGLATSGLTLVGLPGCGYYEAETGEAFTPWNFPTGDARPEREAARAALLAASPHNTQPWGLIVSETRIDVVGRADRNLGTMDGQLRELHIGLGCCIENVVIAAHALGREPTVTLLPDPTNELLVARIELSPAPPSESPLFEAIPRRHTNRGAYADGVPIPGLDDALAAVGIEPGVALRILASSDERARFREETIAATRAIIDDEPMSVDSDRWYRHSKEDIEQFRDGVTLDASGLGAATNFFGKSGSRPSRRTSDSYWLDATENRQTTASAFVLLMTSRESLRDGQLRVGRNYQRLHLWATSAGLAMQPLNQLPERRDREETEGLPARFGDVLADFAGADQRVQMAFRIGYPWDEVPASPRRPLDWVLL